MNILKLLSEEVFDFSSGQMTQTKAKHLKDSMCQQFGDVFTLCQNVMENSNNAALVSNLLFLFEFSSPSCYEEWNQKYLATSLKQRGGGSDVPLFETIKTNAGTQLKNELQ